MDGTARKPYPTDLTDDQWELMQLVIPEAKPGGRPRSADMREIINAMLYLSRGGCQWDMLPHDLPPKSTVYEYFAAWRADSKYHNHDLNAWKSRRADLRWRLEVVSRPAGAKGFVLLAKRWVVERAFAWLGRARRLSRDYEWHTASSECMVRVRGIQVLLNRMAPKNCYAPFEYRVVEN